MAACARLLLLAIVFHLWWSEAFMPNSVFLFRPPGSAVTEEPGLDPTDSFDKFDSAQCGSPLRDGSWSHQDIVRRACLNVVAKFYEETMPILTTGSVQSLLHLTPTTLMRSVFGPQASSAKFEQAIKDLERAASRMDLFYEVNATLDQAANIARVHFDDEEFELGHKHLLQLRRQMFSALQQGSESAARDLAGRFMLTLQDFYAHSNYVELGHDEPLVELGMPGSANFLETVAGKSEATCDDCRTATDTLACSNSCNQNTARYNRLTSGYLFYPTERVGPGYREKPSGKCSHGDPVDQSKTRSATGGINKSTKNCIKSPHYELHDKAAQLAIKATENFLMSIRVVVGDDKFLQFFSLGTTVQGSSLCFVVDQSGSMKDDIDAARNRAKQIVQSSSKPYNYVLVQFNDDDQTPAFGPPIVTQESDEFLRHLDNLRANGGGDCPELAMSGLQLALINCLPGSPIYVFTDAGPKDSDLKATIFSLIDTRKSQVNFFYTGSSPPCGDAPDLFSAIASRSGGQFLSITKGAVAEVTTITQSSTDESQVVLLTASSNETSKTYNILVDCTVTGLVISLSGANPQAEVTGPNGVVTGERVSLPNVLVITVTSPAAGNWMVKTSFSSGDHSVNVKASSTIDFSHEFVTIDGRPGHCGAFPLSGLPIAGTLSKIIYSVRGLEDIVSVDGVDLIDTEGDIINRIDLEKGPVHATHLYGAAFIPPSREFRFRLHGYDKCGSRFTRVSTTTVKAQTVAFSPKGNIESVVSPGKFTNATFELHNSGETNDFDIEVRDDLGTLESLDVEILDVGVDDLLGVRRRRGSSRLVKTVTLKRNQAAKVTVTFGPPKEAKIGSVNTATVTASSQDGKTFNYAVLQVAVVPELDDETPPICSILLNTACDDVEVHYCNESTWAVTARVQDTGVGLQNVRSRQKDVQVSHAAFESATTSSVDVVAMSSCCQLSIDIEAVDVVGNLETCGVAIPPGIEDSDCR
ncbi:von Willebrand factor A domain-containing protein 7-like [Corticium candelabrum]|uniref:von Willebrand factor A domain-containing protein 7-like n=1 Tax=Corticium candelabrum TaxID=121492 RepID=UPI002E2679B3|nr:von Willebrand factor A domain-containing protein 7-like [Corticium candelabrum]